MFVKLPGSFAYGAMCRLSPQAVRLAIDLAVQEIAANNGELIATWSLMRKRGWRSRDTLHKALDELKQHGIIEQTSPGGRNKPARYAVTW